MEKTYEEKIVEDCLKELINEMRYVKNNKNNEYRIAWTKIGCFRLALLRLYHIGFKQGVYTKGAR